MSDLPANSQKAKEEAKKKARPRAVSGSNPLDTSKKEEKKEEVKKIVEGAANVKPVKESAFKRFKNNLFAGDANSVVGYLTSEVLLPALKDLIVDTGSKGLEKMMYGEVKSKRRSSDGKSRFSYNNPIDVRSRPTGGRVPPPSRAMGGRRHMVGEVYLETRGDAERVLETMSELIDRYGVASIADLYGLLGVESNYIDNNWGWTELMFANVMQTANGWLLDLPPVEPL